jgi:hypothetical protein
VPACPRPGRPACGATGAVRPHAGGSSFGAEKAPPGAANARICRPLSATMTRRCSALFKLIRWRTPRLALAIAWAGFGARDGLPVYLAHSLGGGANMALEREIARDLNTSGRRWSSGSAAHRDSSWNCICPPGVSTGRQTPRTCFGQCWSRCHGFGSSIPVASAIPTLTNCPASFCGCAATCFAIGCEARLHDFFPVSPSYCLLGARGAIAARSAARARTLRTATGAPRAAVIDSGSGSAAGMPCSSACDEITAYAPSKRGESSARRSHLSHRVASPRATACRAAGTRHPGFRATVLGVLGNLNAQKGRA